MSKVDRAKVQSVSKEIQEALNTIAEKHGMTAQLGRIRFDETSFRSSIEFTSNSDTGESETRERKALKRHYPGYVDKTVILGGTEYKVVGYNSRAPKRPFRIARKSDGKIFVTTHKDMGLESPLTFSRH